MTPGLDYLHDRLATYADLAISYPAQAIVVAVMGVGLLWVLITPGFLLMRWAEDLDRRRRSRRQEP